MIDAQLRAKGIGSTDISQILGMSPYGDAFAVYARKRGLVDEPVKDLRMRRGSYFEQGIAAWYSDETGNKIEWWNKTIQHPTRTWQVASPDFFVLANDGPEGNDQRIGGGDSKLVNFTESYAWGDPGTDEIPYHYALQMHWLMSTTEMPWWDVAACLGEQLRIFRVERDEEIERTILETAGEFWHDNVLAEVPPPIGHSDTAARYIKQRWPRNVAQLREATPDEVALLFRYKNERAVYNEAKSRKDSLENEIKLIIGEAEGLRDPVLGKITWKRTRDTVGTNWREVAAQLHEELAEVKDAEPLSAYAELHEVVIREGSRRLVVPRTWKSETEDEE